MAKENTTPPATIGKATLESRVTELKTEFTSGQQMLGDLETKKTELQSTLLRISGAIQVLEELLVQADPPKEETTP